MKTKLNAQQMLSIAETFRLAEADLAPRLGDELSSLGYRVTTGENFIYAPGQIPVMLVAHYDTVHGVGKDGRLAAGLAYNVYARCADCSHWLRPDGTGEHYGYCKAPKDAGGRVAVRPHTVLFADGGLGADDRAGVWIVRQTVRAGFRPHVLFCDKEEVGCVGAREAGRRLKKTVEDSDVRLLVQLDRRNADDCVFYQCDNEDCWAYVQRFGFRKAQGSRSDISELMPAWKVAGTNLSVGYYNEHSEREVWHVDEGLATMRRLHALLKDPPGKRLPFVERPAAGPYHCGAAGLGSAEGKAWCYKCKREVRGYDLTWRWVDGQHRRVCWEECCEPAVECRLCWKKVARKDAARHSHCGRTWHTCADQAACKPPLSGVHLRADGYYHLAGGNHHRAALCLAYQAVRGATDLVEEVIDSMGPDDETRLEYDFWEKERKCLDDYCPTCRRFVWVYPSGKCSDCDTAIAWRDGQGRRREEVRKSYLLRTSSR